jgi:hypothetical protein
MAAWIALDTALPPTDRQFDVLHFGDGPRESWIMQPGIWDQWGILPIPIVPGEHCKRSTITHWRLRDVKLTGDR